MTDASTAQEASQVEDAPQQDAGQPEYDPYVGAMAALGVEVDEDDQPAAANADNLPAGDQQSVDAEAAASQPDQPQEADQQAAEQADDLPAAIEDGRVVIRDADAVIVDPDGNEWRAADVIWRTQQYHRKLAERDQQMREQMQRIEELDRELQIDPAGLAKKIIAAADPAQRLAAAADVLRETGLADIAEQVQQAMTAGGLQYDPLQAERQRIEAERQRIEAERQRIEGERRQMEVQQRLAQETAEITASLGRDITEREWDAIAQVAEAHAIRSPGQPLTLREAYDRAARLLRVEEAERRASRQKQKPEAVSTVETASRPPQVDSLDPMDYVDGAMAALGIT